MQGQFSIWGEASIAAHTPIEQGVTLDAEKAFHQIQHLFMIKKKRIQ